MSVGGAAARGAPDGVVVALALFGLLVLSLVGVLGIVDNRFPEIARVLRRNPDPPAPGDDKPEDR